MPDHSNGTEPTLASLARHNSLPHRRAPDASRRAQISAGTFASSGPGLSKRASVTWADHHQNESGGVRHGLGLSDTNQTRSSLSNTMASPTSASASGSRHGRSLSTSNESLSPSSDRYYADELEDAFASGPATSLRRHQSLNLRSSPASQRNGHAGYTHSRGSSEDIVHSLRSSPTAASLGHRRRSQSTTVDAFSSSAQLPSPVADAVGAFGVRNAKRNSGSGSAESGSSSPLRSPFEGKSPWSPTAEEVAMLGTSGIPAAKLSPSLDSSFSQMDLNPPKPAYKQYSTDSFSSANSDATYQPNLTAPLSRPQLPNGAPSPLGRKITPALPPLVTSFSSAHREQSSPVSASNAAKPALPFQGPFSAAAYVRPIGHSTTQRASETSFTPARREAVQLHDKGAFTAAPGTSDIWQRQKAKIAGTSPISSLSQPSGIDAQPPLRRGNSGQSRLNSAAAESPGVQQHQQPFSVTQQMQLLASLSQQQQQYQPNLWNPPPSLPQWQGTDTSLHSSADTAASLQPQTVDWTSGHVFQPWQQPMQTSYNHQSPILSNNTRSFVPSAPNTPALVPAAAPAVSPEVQQMITAKGLNPPSFDITPKKASFCVIKSYTEDDIHKSIKFDIWSSTKLGNQRLDRVFSEANSKDAPLYLFFSVNGSGHFCGIAEMLSQVDETVSSEVWAEAKWKGIFTLRWIFIKDVPNAALRHIRLTNTQENKPVTSSRDTQEVPYEAGLEMLRIITSYQSKTSLLQDFAHYEALEAQKKFLTSQIASASNATVSPSLTASAPSSAYSQWTQPIPYPHHFGNAPPAQIRT